MNFKSIADLSRDLKNDLLRIPSDTDLIVGVPRSGLLAANLLSVYTHIPYLPLDRYIKFVQKNHSEPALDLNKRYLKILVVDDSLNEGRALKSVKKKLAELPQEPGRQYLFSCVYVKPGAEKQIDIPIVTLGKPRLFEWNIFHHKAMVRTMIELENVLCIPLEGQGVDNDAYESAIENAQALIVPTTVVGTIISERPEKYRDLTEAWLARNNFHYKQLIMGAPASMRKERYARSFRMDLYVTADPAFALEIYQETKKDVYSLSENKMLVRKFSVHRLQKRLFFYYQLIKKKISGQKEQHGIPKISILRIPERGLPGHLKFKPKNSIHPHRFRLGEFVLNSRLITLAAIDH